MQKQNKLQNNKKERLIILITVIVIIGVIIGSIVIRNVVVNQQAEGESYLAGGNGSSALMASYIKKGITIGGITGSLEVLDTSDANATPEDLLEGKTAYVDGVKITGTMKVEPEPPSLGDITGSETSNTTVKDKYGNKVVVPAGFIVANPQYNVENGIIIQDVSAGDSNTRGNQFVWIPVGKIQTSEGEKEIILGEYRFDASGNESLTQSADDSDEFVIKAKQSGGYYIGRYEAGDALATSSPRTESTSDTNPMVCKAGVYPYTYIGQTESESLCQNMYSSNNFTSDLTNDYAWDTAVVFIQKCSGDKNYSRQGGQNTKRVLQKVGESILANVDSGDESRDVRCNIYDIAGNTREWSTTYGSSMGGDYNLSNYGPYSRSANLPSFSHDAFAFRPFLYL